MEHNQTELLEVIQSVVAEFGSDTTAVLEDSIRRLKLVSSAQLLRSLTHQTRADTYTKLVVLEIAFELHGRYQDMKRINQDTLPPFEEIEKWVKRKGVARFGTDPRPNKRKPKSSKRRINEIAWGIMRSRSKRRTRKAWFSKTFYDRLALLREEIALGVSDRALEEVIGSLSTTKWQYVKTAYR